MYIILLILERVISNNFEVNICLMRKHLSCPDLPSPPFPPAAGLLELFVPLTSELITCYVMTDG